MTDIHHIYLDILTSDIELDGVTLTVDYEFQEPEEGEREPGTGLLLSPEIPPLIYIEGVSHAGYDITDLLSDDTFDRIERVLIERYEHSKVASYEDHIRDKEEDL
jgi:hypothetical protein